MFLTWLHLHYMTQGYTIHDTNTKQLQKQNSIKHNTRPPGKCIMCIISRPVGIPVLAVTYNDT